MTRTEKLLAELVALPSVNPAFAPAGPGAPAARDAAGTHGEQRVADFLAATAAQAGLDVEFQPVLPGRSNLIARLLPKRKITRTILLAPHMDTVGAGPGQWAPRLKNGRMYGRGTCDTKGSVAAMLAALCELAAHAQRPSGTQFIFAGLVDEEQAQAGSRALARSGLKADLAIVGEPTQLRLVTAHKGSLWLQVATRGRAAHGATPHLGQNAVHAMARVVDALETGYASRLGRKKHPLLGPATVNVGKIAGGTQPNIVPDACTILVDRRTLPGESDAGVIREIARYLKGKNLSARVSNTKIAPAPALETPFGLPLVRQFARSLGQRQPLGVDYFCDAAILSQAGLPSVIFGPGNIAQAHTADEWISLSQLEAGQVRLLRFLKSLS